MYDNEKNEGYIHFGIIPNQEFYISRVQMVVIFILLVLNTLYAAVVNGIIKFQFILCCGTVQCAQS